MQQQQPELVKAPQLPCIAEQQQPRAQQQTDSVQPRPHANRPSRLSAVLVPPAPASAGAGASSTISPPPSPPSSQAWPAGMSKPASCDGLCKADKQENSSPVPAPRVSPRAGADAPAARGSTAASPPPPSSPPAGSPRSKAGRPAGKVAVTPADAQAAPTCTLAHAASRKPGPAAPSPESDASSSIGEDPSDWAWDSATPWYCQPRRVAVIVLLLAPLGLVLAGLVLQVVFRDQEGLVTDYRKVFPWLYFFAAFPPLALALRWLCWKLYQAAEYTAVVREELYFMRPLKAKLAGLLFWMTNLLWFQACFHWLWCHEVCDEEGYQQALLVVWRLLICVTLFAAANFLKCAIARLLSYSFYRTAHFVKVRDAIERELYLIRLSQARSNLLPPPAPEPCSDLCDQQDGLPGHRAGAWGSTIWRKTSQVFLGPHAQQPGCQQGAAEAPDPDQADQEGSSTAAAVSAFAGALAQQQSMAGGMRHVSSADRIVEDAAVHVHVRQFSETQQKQQPGSTARGPMLGDNVPLLQSSATPTPEVSWLQADLLKAHQHQQHVQHLAQQSQCPQPGRQHSYEIFAADRMPSFLGPQAHASRSGSKAGSKAGSRAGSRIGQGLLRSGRTGSRFSTGSTRHVALPGMVAGVDGLLLQPEVLEKSGSADGQAARSPGQAMTELELAQLRKRLGVNTFGTFVDRYYGMTPKEEAAHVRQVKRFAKGLFANVLGEADRDHILPEDMLLFFDDDLDSAHDAFEYFDRNNDGSISCLELQESAAEMLRERKNIAASIKDTDSVVNSLETGLGMLIHFIFIALYLLVFNVNIVQGFTTFSTLVLGLVFVFGDSVKGVFESAIFLFLEHPYDVGDALWIPPGVIARVKRLDLQYTVLAKSDGQLVWHPNNLLRTQPLINLSRSNPRWEGYTWLVDIDTPDEVLTQLQAALAAHVATQRAHFSCDPAVTWRGMEDPLKLRLAVGVTYSFTGEDVGRYVAARHGILSVVRRQLHRMGVKYTLPLQQQSFTPLVQQATTPLQ